ncbi:MAG: DUF1573 domain-containing protein [Flavobacteriaceae bacterium]|nr:DUF1573 domain-containing protein [Flavobacteriaceae bacterium]
MKQLLALTILVTFSLISCKENVASKINKENLEVAKERDYKLNQGAAAITFSNTEHDFGVINEGDIVETTFSFKNTGKSELIITNAVGSCGCTVPEWPKEPIAVGESGQIKVKFNSQGKPNKQSKTITLTTNTANGKETVLVKAEVTPKQKAS